MGLNIDNINFFKISDFLNNKKIILFSVGLVCKKFIDNFDKSKILFIVDNNNSLWNTKFENIPVKNPNKLKNIKDVEIVIMTTSFTDVFKQVKKINSSLDVKVSDYLKDRIKIEALQSLKKKIIISSGLPALNEKNSGGGLYEIELDGIKWNIKKVYSGNVHGIIKISNGFAISDSTNGIVLLDKNYKIKKRGQYPLKTRGHGIAFDKDKNFFYVVCTNTDKIKVFNKNLKLVDTISISDKFKKYNLPQHHMNDICINNGNLYVSMFSLSGNHRSSFYDGGVYEVCMNDKKVKSKMYGNLTMPHSIKFINDSFVILDSLKGNLVIGNSKVATFSGFTRGLSYDGSYYYVGQRRNRNFSLIKASKTHVSIDNSVLIFDIKNKISRTLQLPFSISEVHEVLAL